jgi:hypothetical protein
VVGYFVLISITQLSKEATLAIDLTVPQWVQEKISYWQEALGLSEWRIYVALALVLENDSEIQGTCLSTPNLNMARIQLRADIEDNKEWEEVIVHELLHAKHARIDGAVLHIRAPQISGGGEMIRSIYNQQLEPYIESMAQCLVKMRRQDK